MCNLSFFPSSLLVPQRCVCHLLFLLLPFLLFLLIIYTFLPSLIPFFLSLSATYIIFSLCSSSSFLSYSYIFISYSSFSSFPFSDSSIFSFLPFFSSSPPNKGYRVLLLLLSLLRLVMSPSFCYLPFLFPAWKLKRNVKE